MLTLRESEIAKRLKTYIQTETQKKTESVVSGLEGSQYLKAVAEIKTLRDVLKELDAIEKDIRADR